MAIVQVPPDAVRDLAAGKVPTLTRIGRITSAGRYLLSLSNDELRQTITATADESSSLHLLDFMLDHAQVGSYTYNDPENEDDATVVPFGKVPPIVFSEVMGDLKKIAAQAARSESE